MNISENHCLTYSGICAALGAISLSIGFYLQVSVSFWTFVASVCVMLSLETGRMRYSVLVYTVITVLSLFFNGCNVIFLLPFITFMGTCPMACFVFERTRAPFVVSYCIKQIWFTGSTILMAWFGPVFFGVNLVDLKAAIIIAAFSVPSFFFYNWGMGNIQRKFRQFMARAPH